MSQVSADIPAMQAASVHVDNARTRIMGVNSQVAATMSATTGIYNTSGGDLTRNAMEEWNAAMTKITDALDRMNQHLRGNRSNYQSAMSADHGSANAVATALNGVRIS